MITKKANTDFYLKIDTSNDLMGLNAANFGGYSVDDGTGTITNLTNGFSEIIRTVAAPATTTVSAAAAIGAKVISLTDASGFSVHDTISLNGTVYGTIKSIASNQVTMVSPIKFALADTNAVTVIGNTGIYQVLMNLPVGEYTVFLSNAEVGMDNHPVSIDVQENTHDDLMGKMNELQTDLNETSFV